MRKKFLLASFMTLAFAVAFAQQQTGTLKIFSEFTGVNIYLDENLVGTDVKEMKDVQAGSHYLKVMKDGVSIFSELVTISPGNVTTVLVKNTGQVQEKILDSKTKEQEEYHNSKVDVILSRGMTTQTQGYSTLFPGYYSYWGVSNSVSTSTETTDWKIIQGGVKEISEYQLANLANNSDIVKAINAQTKKDNKMTNTGAIIFLVSVIPTAVILADFLGSKHFLHKSTPEHPNSEVVIATGGIVGCVFGYAFAMHKPYRGHYYNVDNAAKDAQDYNRKLKTKLGLPDSYDMNK